MKKSSARVWAREKRFVSRTRFYGRGILQGGEKEEKKKKRKKKKEEERRGLIDEMDVNGGETL